MKWCFWPGFMVATTELNVAGRNCLGLDKTTAEALEKALWVSCVALCSSGLKLWGRGESPASAPYLKVIAAT